MRTLLPLLTLFALSACGISNGTPILDLTADEWVKVCESMNMPEKTVTCEVDGTEYEVTVGMAEGDCDDFGPGTDELSESCAATVGDLKECSSDLYDDPCAEELPESCDEFFACF